MKQVIINLAAGTDILDQSRHLASGSARHQTSLQSLQTRNRCLAGGLRPEMLHTCVAKELCRCTAVGGVIVPYRYEGGAHPVTDCLTNLSVALPDSNHSGNPSFPRTRECPLLAFRGTGNEAI